MPEASGLAGGVERIAKDAERRFGRSGNVMGASMARGLDQSAQKAKTAMREVEKATEGLSKARQQDEDAAGRVRVAQAKLDDVLAKGRSTTAQRVTAEEGLARAQRQRERTAEDLTRAEKGLTRATEARDRAVTDGAEEVGEEGGIGAGGGFVMGFGSKLKGLAGKGGVIGAAILGAGLVAYGAGKVIGGQVMQGLAAEQNRDLVQARLALDEESMARVARAAGTAYGQNFGDSVAENLGAAQTAMESGLLPRDAGTGQIQEVIEQLQTVKSIMGVELPEASRAAGQLIRTGLAENSAEAADILVAGQQKGLNMAGDWLDTISEYSTQFRKLGIDGADAVGLIAQMQAAGARDTDAAADALKEFSIRVIDGSDATNDAFEAIGKNGEEMAARFAVGGPEARAAMEETLDALRAMPDPVARSRVAVGLFGTQVEDLGGAFDAMDLGKVSDEVDGVAGAAERAADTMNDNAATSIEKARRSMELGWRELQRSAAGAFGPMLQTVADEFSDHQGDIVNFFAGVGAAAIDGGNAMGAFTSGALRGLSWLVRGFNSAFGSMIEQFSSFLEFSGKAISWVPGMSDDAKMLENLGKAGKKFVDGMSSAPDTLNDWADAVDRGREGLPDMADDLRDSGRRAAEAQGFVNSLGDALDEVTMRDDGKVVLESNAPEVLDQIDRTKFAVENIGPGEVELVPLTEDATREMEAWRVQQGGEPTMVTVGADLGPAREDLDRFVREITGQQPQRMPVTVNPSLRDMMLPPGGATGGRVNNIIRGPGSGTSDSILARSQGGLLRVSNGESINTERSTRDNWPLINAMNQGRDPLEVLGRIAGYAEGGVVGLMNTASQLVGTGYVRGGHDYSGVDCSGAASMLVNAALGLPVSGDRMATGNAAEWLEGKGFRSGSGPAGTLRVGWKNGGPGGGHMAVTLPDGRNAESGGSVGDFTVGSGAAGADDPQFTNQAYLPMEALYPDGYPSGFVSPMGSGYGSGGSSGGSGYSSAGERAAAISDAENDLADAEGRVREREARLAEVQADADAKESQKISAEEALAKAQRDRDEARADLAEAQNTPVDTGTGSSSGSSGPDGGSFAQDMIGGALEAIGLDGSVFSNPMDWGIWKLATGGANWLGGMLKNIAPAEGGGPGPFGGPLGPAPGPGNDGGLGGLSLGEGGDISSVGDTLTAALPQARDFLPSAATGAPGPIDASTHFHGNVGMDPKGITTAIDHKRNDRVRTAGSGLRGTGGGF